MRCVSELCQQLVDLGIVISFVQAHRLRVFFRPQNDRCGCSTRLSPLLREHTLHPSKVRQHLEAVSLPESNAALVLLKNKDVAFHYSLTLQ
jgi:hypothetical protein